MHFKSSCLSISTTEIILSYKLPRVVEIELGESCDRHIPGLHQCFYHAITGVAVTVMLHLRQETEFRDADVCYGLGWETPCPSYLAPTSPVFIMTMRRVACVWYTTGPKGRCSWSREISRAWQQPLRRKRGRSSPIHSINTSSEKGGTRFLGAKVISSLQTSLGFRVILWKGSKVMT